MRRLLRQARIVLLPRRLAAVRRVHLATGGVLLVVALAWLTASRPAPSRNALTREAERWLAAGRLPGLACTALGDTTNTRLAQLPARGRFTCVAHDRGADAGLDLREGAVTRLHARWWRPAGMRGLALSDSVERQVVGARGAPVRCRARALPYEPLVADRRLLWMPTPAIPYTTELRADSVTTASMHGETGIAVSLVHHQLTVSC